MSSTQLTQAELEQRLEALVYMVLTVHRSVEPAALELAAQPREAQERFLDSVEYIASQTAELAYNFTAFGAHTLARLDAADWSGWVKRILDTYDQGGVIAAIRLMQHVGDYRREVRDSQTGVALDEVRVMLEHFVHGLSGRPLTLQAGEQVYTDTEKLYVPELVCAFADRAQNRSLIKAMVVHQWAQTWYGTWHIDVAERVRSFSDPARALRTFHALEVIRLDAQIARDLPGIHREMEALRAAEGTQLDEALCRRTASLTQDGADVEESCLLLDQLIQDPCELPGACYQGRLLPDLVQPLIEQRKRRDRQLLQEALAYFMAGDESAQERAGAGEPPPGEAPEVRVVRRAAPELPAGFQVRLEINGEPVPPHEEVQAALDSIVQDFGDVPDDYLVPAGHGNYRPSAAHPQDAQDGASHRDGLEYDEWDHLRQQYRKGFCRLFERDVHPVFDDFVEQTRHKYHGLLKHIYRTFEALRGEDRNLKRQPQGDGVDIDAVVESFADQHTGREASECLFTRRQNVERDIAVVFLVDMSGSTKGWINEIERESLVLLCEALEMLGDRYAIYGFSGFTHRRCELFRVKGMDQDYDAQVQARISGILPQDYTRLGVFIRHATRLFSEVEARTKLLITLSDGRPDDQDGYRGAYGIEDTRQALIEARHQGIHPFCITIDDEALEYLPHMYGGVHFTVVSDVHKLPYKVSDIYRRITV
ncbi:MAG: VWA domain-containing protein [Pseudomonadota bacterium]|nr:MAG: VWA domain-containing protein [Pseudomonadota bacterium]